MAAPTMKKSYTRYLKCEFSDAEMTLKARDLAASNRRRSAIEQQKKEIDSDLKSKIEAENTAIGRLSEQIGTGHEYRDVECVVSLDRPSDGQKTIIRLDTGEEIAVERMTDEDRQMALDLEEDARQESLKNAPRIPENRRIEKRDDDNVIDITSQDPKEPR